MASWLPSFREQGLILPSGFAIDFLSGIIKCAIVFAEVDDFGKHKRGGI